MKTILSFLASLAFLPSLFGGIASNNLSLDADFIKSTDPFDIAVKAYALTIKYLYSKSKDADKAALTLPRPWRAVYSTYLLECETTNGGLAQFFDNTPRQLHAAADDDLKLIGAKVYLPLYQKARLICYDPETERNSHDKQVDSINAEYFRLSEKKSVSRYLGEYIKSNPDIFIKQRAEQGAAANP